MVMKTMLLGRDTSPCLVGTKDVATKDVGTKDWDSQTHNKPQSPGGQIVGNDCGTADADVSSGL